MENKNIFAGVVVITLVIGAYYFGVSSNNVNNHQASVPINTSANLNTQQQCSSAATNYFETWKANPKNNDLGVTAGGNLGFSNHYNTTLNKCLIRIESNPYYNNTQTEAKYRIFASVYLYDIYENKLLGNADIMMDNSIFLCGFPNLPTSDYKTYCGTSDTFLNKVKEYMTN